MKTAPLPPNGKPVKFFITYHMNGKRVISQKGYHRAYAQFLIDENSELLTEFGCTGARLCHVTSKSKIVLL